jgi:hypothetical protein
MEWSFFFWNWFYWKKQALATKPIYHVKDILHYLCYILSQIMSRTPFQMLHFMMVFRYWDQQLLEGWGYRKREPSSIPHRVEGSVHNATASWALVGGGHAAVAIIASVRAGVRWGLEGAGVFLVGASLFSWEGALALLLPFSIPDCLLASLEIGQWCHFSALHVANLHLHNLHCQCGWPRAASLVAFQLSCLTVHVLFHAKCFFSFWA